MLKNQGMLQRQAFLRTLVKLGKIPAGCYNEPGSFLGKGWLGWQTELI